MRCAGSGEPRPGREAKGRPRRRSPGELPTHTVVNSPGPGEFWSLCDQNSPSHARRPTERTAATYARLRTALTGTKDDSLPDDIKLHRTWVPYVGRYSFETARIPW